SGRRLRGSQLPACGEVDLRVAQALVGRDAGFRRAHQLISVTNDEGVEDDSRVSRPELGLLSPGAGEDSAASLTSRFRYVRCSSTAPRSMPTSCHSVSRARITRLLTSGSVATIASAAARSSQRST